jgi:hypothetical protein
LKQKINYSMEYLKLFFLVIFLLELLVFSISLICGQFLGYRASLLVGTGIGIVIVICFMTVMFFNGIIIGIQKTIERITKKRDLNL